jgi:hypothetical protein
LAEEGHEQGPSIPLNLGSERSSVKPVIIWGTAFQRRGVQKSRERPWQGIQKRDIEAEGVAKAR